MSWKKERDLLIAQTMAFVQSVTGKQPDAEFLFVPDLHGVRDGGPARDDQAQ